MSKTFQISPELSSTNATSTASDSDSEDNLPYPADLSRQDFLIPNFSPQTYLSTLRNRHQTLEDLRSDLRQRSQLLNAELLDLVNGHYAEFLSLGQDLKGGEEKVEGVRVGLLGFEREVSGIRDVVQERMEEVGKLVDEKKTLRKEMLFGRGLLEVEALISELEEGLGVAEKADTEELDDLDDEDEAEEETSSVPVAKLRRQTQQFILISRSIERLGSQHPFLQTQTSRVDQLRKTLLLDMGSALKQAKAAQASDATLALVGLYADLGAQADGVKALKGG